MLMRCLPIIFIAPLLAFPNVVNVSGCLVDQFLSRIFLNVSALMQVTSAPVSYRALTCNEFLITQLINSLKCKEFILYSFWSQKSFLILLIN